MTSLKLEKMRFRLTAENIKQPAYGPITFRDKRKVVGGNSSLAGTPDGLAGYATMAYRYFTDDIATVMNSEAAINERALSGFFLLPTPFKLLKPLDDVAGAKKAADVGKVGKGTGELPSDFADRVKLEGHFDKHGKEFDGLYKNANEYLEGAKEVINNGIKVKYEYKDEIRTGYVKFMGNNKHGKAKFEFVGTNNNGDITTYHTQSGKKIWKTINGENIPVINPAE
ncbi:hypothetical protein [Virgibacillus halodenitrificans]|uniref:Uncharacterized protein n=1 Tax=Virgibacillus halodenitrificans TaxID=1482 RepID=A0ABR7VJ45_VIRHA|nr:hypothetical protein [Virgibacillus halodenitrificans]MBD1221956.1 hypothetical protein [Virgibacillus halodenitrificans]MYL58326.1 hypothetical protein [Virgibacillus halodenitrificans]